MSPSSRRAWIEIFMEYYEKLHEKYVALLAEGVDRNMLVNEIRREQPSRPPRGGRG